MKTIILSKLGHDFNGKKLTEKTLSYHISKQLKCDTLVFWGGTFFEIGNTRNNLIELYKNGEFIETVDFESIRLVKAPKKLYL